MYEGYLLTKKRSLDMETLRFITRYTDPLPSGRTLACEYAGGLAHAPAASARHQVRMGERAAFVHLEDQAGCHDCAGAGQGVPLQAAMDSLAPDHLRGGLTPGAHSNVKGLLSVEY
jgi:hypothetical protein